MHEKERRSLEGYPTPPGHYRRGLDLVNILKLDDTPSMLVTPKGQSTKLPAPLHADQYRQSRTICACTSTARPHPIGLFMGRRPNETAKLGIAGICAPLASILDRLDRTAVRDLCAQAVSLYRCICPLLLRPHCHVRRSMRASRSTTLNPLPLLNPLQMLGVQQIP